MNRQPMSMLQSDLSKLLSHLLEEDITLSEDEARQIALHVSRTHPLDVITHSIIPNGK